MCTANAPPDDSSLTLVIVLGCGAGSGTSSPSRMLARIFTIGPLVKQYIAASNAIRQINSTFERAPVESQRVALALTGKQCIAPSSAIRQINSTFEPGPVECQRVARHCDKKATRTAFDAWHGDNDSISWARIDREEEELGNQMNRIAHVENNHENTPAWIRGITPRNSTCFPDRYGLLQWRGEF